MIYLLILAFPIMILLNKIIADNSVKAFSVFFWIFVALGIGSLLLIPIVAWGKWPLWMTSLITFGGLIFYVWLLIPNQ
ncbi:hypothetical protein J7K24_03170 [bacterium]|nr:hypothetical protein [bacterium]